MFDQPILGIDPGLSRCGYGAVLVQRGTARAVAYGVIRTDPSLPVPQRLIHLSDELDSLLADLAPLSVSVERVLFQSNVRTAISVGQASGLALVAAARRSLPVAEYSPNEVKLAVTGDGRADKVSVQAMVSRILRLTQAPSPPDAADALALALTHAWRVRQQRGDVSVASTTSGFEAAVEAALAKELR